MYLLDGGARVEGKEMDLPAVLVLPSDWIAGEPLAKALPSGWVARGQLSLASSQGSSQ